MLIILLINLPVSSLEKEGHNWSFHKFIVKKVTELEAQVSTAGQLLIVKLKYQPLSKV